MTETERDGQGGVQQVGSLALLLPGGRVYDLAARALVARIEVGFLTPRVLVRTGAGVTLMVEAGLRELSATELLTGERQWQAPGAFSRLSVIHAGGRALVTMSQVKKWGGGARCVVDAATGKELPESQIGPAFPALPRSGRFVGSPGAPGLFAWIDEAELRVFRSSDGAQIAHHAWPAPAPAAVVSTTVDGHRVTEQTFDFSTPPEAIHFGAGGYLVLVGSTLLAGDAEGAPVFSVPLPAGSTLVEARWHEGGWRGLLRSPQGKVDVVAFAPSGIGLLWADCEGVALVGDELLTATLGVGRVSLGRVEATLPASEELATPRREGAIHTPPALLAALGKLRGLSADTGPTGLSLSALQRVEAALGQGLPSWALAVLAAQAKSVEKAWGLSLEGIAALTAELAEVDRKQLSLAGFRPTPLPAGLVALGKQVSSKKARRRGRSFFAIETTYWCVHEGQSILLRCLDNEDLTPEGKPTGISTGMCADLGEPIPANRVLAPLIDALRKKARGKAPALEAQGIAALGALQLLP